MPERTLWDAPPRWMGTLTDADELAMNRGSVGSQAPVQYPYEKPRLTLPPESGLIHAAAYPSSTTTCRLPRPNKGGVSTHDSRAIGVGLCSFLDMDFRGLLH
jgi:hypothetical protein